MDPGDSYDSAPAVYADFVVTSNNGFTKAYRYQFTGMDNPSDPYGQTDLRLLSSTGVDPVPEGSGVKYSIPNVTENPVLLEFK